MTGDNEGGRPSKKVNKSAEDEDEEITRGNALRSLRHLHEDVADHASRLTRLERNRGLMNDGNDDPRRNAAQAAQAATHQEVEANQPQCEQAADAQRPAPRPHGAVMISGMPLDCNVIQIGSPSSFQNVQVASTLSITSSHSAPNGGTNESRDTIPLIDPVTTKLLRDFPRGNDQTAIQQPRPRRCQSRIDASYTGHHNEGYTAPMPGRVGRWYFRTYGQPQDDPSSDEGHARMNLGQDLENTVHPDANEVHQLRQREIRLGHGYGITEGIVLVWVPDNEARNLLGPHNGGFTRPQTQTQTQQQAGASVAGAAQQHQLHREPQPDPSLDGGDGSSHGGRGRTQHRDRAKVGRRGNNRGDEAEARDEAEVENGEGKEDEEGAAGSSDAPEEFDDGKGYLRSQWTGYVLPKKGKTTTPPRDIYSSEIGGNKTYGKARTTRSQSAQLANPLPAFATTGLTQVPAVQPSGSKSKATRNRPGRRQGKVKKLTSAYQQVVSATESRADRRLEAEEISKKKKPTKPDQPPKVLIQARTGKHKTVQVFDSATGDITDVPRNLSLADAHFDLNEPGSNALPPSVLDGRTEAAPMLEARPASSNVLRDAEGSVNSGLQTGMTGQELSRNQSSFGGMGMQPRGPYLRPMAMEEQTNILKRTSEEVESGAEDDETNRSPKKKVKGESSEQLDHDDGDQESSGEGEDDDDDLTHHKKRK